MSAKYYTSGEDDDSSQRHHSSKKKRNKSSLHSKHKSTSKKMRRTTNSPHGILIPKKKTLRRIYRKGRLNIATTNEHILIVDGTCDQSIIHALACQVIQQSSQYFHVGGAIHGMESDIALQVCDVVVLITHPYTGNK